MMRARAASLAAVLAALVGQALVVPARSANAAQDVDVHAFVNDTCIMADEPFYVPELDR